MKYITTVDGKEFEIEVVDDKHIRVGGRLLAVDFESVIASSSSKRSFIKCRG